VIVEESTRYRIPLEWVIVVESTRYRIPLERRDFRRRVQAAQRDGYLLSAGLRRESFRSGAGNGE